MTQNEMLQSNMLDILFEHRNKDYGAYALRRGYEKNMLIGLGVGISVLALVILLVNGNRHQSVTAKNDNRKEMVIREYTLPPEKPKVPETPKQAPKPKAVAKVPAAPKVQSVQFTTPKITDVVKVPVPDVTDLGDKQISDKTSKGVPDNGKPVVQTPVVTNTGTGAGPSQPVVEPEFVVQERDPEYPGGANALRNFLSRNLRTPDDLQGGETRVVKVRFRVEKDGSVNSFEIVASGGSDFDSEVLRVCKKMSRWTPAIQNGTNVPVSYVLPVTFIGLEG
mgnify:CR=1 FL=1